MQFELVSFALCPYVQRSVITMKWKKADFKVTYIDLQNPPEWFDQISPLGQVPVLKVNEKEIIFESAVINEFFDELVPPQLHPKNLVQKAKERSWIEYGSSLLGDQYLLMKETNSNKLNKLTMEFFEGLARLEPVLGEGPYFRGQDFSLVDAAYAPLFMRLELIPTLSQSSEWAEMPKVKAWSKSLLALPEVKESVLPDFSIQFKKMLKEIGSALLK